MASSARTIKSIVRNGVSGLDFGNARFAGFHALGQFGLA
jgi:hypothetical protein